MARIFLTKVCGFSPEDYPALGFNTEGARLKFLRKSEPGDWVVLAGTRAAPTQLNYQGRLLGEVQLGTEQIDVEEVLRSIGTEIPEDHYREDGKYRWPFGLPMISTERFADLPDLAELFGDYLPGTQWASYALDIGETLGSEAQAKVEALRTEPAQIADAPAIVRQRERQRALVLNRDSGPTGPGPSSTRTGSDRTPGAASAYVLELQGGPRKVIKAGYTTDVEDRVSSLNKGLVPIVTGYSWKLILRQAFATENQAYAFEQIIHNRLRQYRVEGEQEIYSITLNGLNSVWSDVFFRSDWAVS
jgi:hypothetical protein